MFSSRECMEITNYRYKSNKSLFNTQYLQNKCMLFIFNLKGGCKIYKLMIVYLLHEHDNPHFADVML